METTSALGRGPTALAPGNKEKRTAFGARMLDCVSRAFDSVGTGPLMRDYIYWSLSLGMDDIVDRPERFMEALREVMGDAGATVYEYKLVEEIRKEFQLLRAPGKQPLTGERGPGGALRAVMTTAWMAC